MPIYSIPCEINVDAASAPEAEEELRGLFEDGYSAAANMTLERQEPARVKLANKMYRESEHPEPFEGDHPDDPR